jgi:hypothetical protein
MALAIVKIAARRFSSTGCAPDTPTFDIVIAQRPPLSVCPGRKLRDGQSRSIAEGFVWGAECRSFATVFLFLNWSRI